MKVFISWSGELSRELAEALRDWLPGVLQSVRPFFTPNDIEKGARWNKDIAKELESSSIGIFCLTAENLTKPWIMFEAGALSKSVDASRVCPILFNVDSADLEGPLVQFQASPFNETEIRKLLKTINAVLGEQKLDDAVLTAVFDMWWPKLNEKVQAILAKAPRGDDRASRRSDRDLLEELLKLSRLNTTGVQRRPLGGAAIVHIVRIALDVKAKLINDAETVEILTALSELEKPISYLSRRLDVSPREREQLLSLLGDLSPQEIPREEEILHSDDP
ncbi:MAG: hypothetical protein JWR07_746 [Nevskia sp.]|nr:hypothetical protein [Nevskia sp.]